MVRHRDCVRCPHRADEYKSLVVDQHSCPLMDIHKSTLLMSSFLPFQHVLFEMEGKWPYGLLFSGLSFPGFVQYMYTYIYIYMCVCVCNSDKIQVKKLVVSLAGRFMPNNFNKNNHFYSNQFSLAWVHGIIVKNISISTNSIKYKYRFCLHTVKCQNFYFKKIQFNISTVSMSKTIPFQAIHFSMNMQPFYFKLFSFVKQGFTPLQRCSRC